ncbi:MAG TPA: hypothetical protein VM123_11855 [archaeon]|nr:hypothetical protein [archaeon]
MFDSSWALLVLDKTISKKIITPADTLWIAVHRVVLDPGPYIYALRMNIPGYRAVGGNKLRILPYLRDELELSGVILGSPPVEGQQVHRRMGVDILPRPSLAFRPGETITVYFEIYGLGNDPQGGRSYSERVSVSLVKGQEAKGGALKKMFSPGKELTKSLLLTFDRQPREAQGPVAEHFTIDTSYLVAGSYRLVIQVEDTSTGQRRQIGCFFELAAGE